jgi:hypothetical protein
MSGFIRKWLKRLDIPAEGALTIVCVQQRKMVGYNRHIITVR